MTSPVTIQSQSAAELAVDQSVLEDPRPFAARQSSLNPSQKRKDIILAVMANGHNAFRTFVQEVLMEEKQNRPICRNLIGQYTFL